MHFSHCIYRLYRFTKSSEIPGGSTRALLRSERGRAREIETQCSSRETLNILKRVGGTRGAITIINIIIVIVVIVVFVIVVVSSAS